MLKSTKFDIIDFVSLKHFDASLNFPNNTVDKHP
jgi:hypothetical protein